MTKQFVFPLWMTKKSQQFKEYLNNNVIIVRTVLPSDTDVAAYFEIMNNRGEQLQEHEIIKALMMKELDSHQRMIFSCYLGCPLFTNEHSSAANS